MTRINPYVGPRAFTKDDSHLFFGRDREAADLVALTIANSLLVLHAQSGVGKSSIIAARVIGGLEKEKCHCLGIGRVQLADTEESASSQGGSVFVRALARSLGWSAAPSGNGTLLEYAERAIAAYWQEHGGAQVRPNDMTRFLLVIDQFEELYTARPDLWAEREPFLQQLSSALRALPRLTVLLCVREELLAHTMHIGRIMAGLNIGWYRLERLDRDAARAAIVGPLQKTGISFAPRAVEKLVNLLFEIPSDAPAAAAGAAAESTGGADDAPMSEYAEPMHLQVVCETLWESLPADQKQITERMVDVSGRVEDALDTYYERSIRHVVEKRAASEAAVRGWIEQHLITAARTRALVRKEANTTRGMPNDVLEILTRRYLLREERRGKDTWYELSHDRLVQPVFQSNLRWREQTGVRTLWEQLEAKAADCHPTQPLLKGQELKEAIRLIEREDVRQYGVSTALKDLVARSLEYEKEQRDAYLRKVRVSVYAVAGLTFLIGGWFGGRYTYSRAAAVVAAYGEVAKELAGDPEKLLLATYYALRAEDSAMGRGQKQAPRELLDTLVTSMDDTVRITPLTEARPQITLAPGGTAVARYGFDGLTVWALPSTKILLRVNGPIVDVQFSGDDQRVAVTATVSESTRVFTVFNLLDRAVVSRLESRCTTFGYYDRRCAVLSSDLASIAMRSEDQLRVVEMGTGDEQMSLPIPGDIAEVAWARRGPALYAISMVDDVDADLVYARPAQRECFRWSRTAHEAWDPCETGNRRLSRGVQALLASDGRSVLVATPIEGRRQPETLVAWYSLERKEFDGFKQLPTQVPVYLSITSDGQTAAVASMETGQVWLRELGDEGWIDGEPIARDTYHPRWLPTVENAIVGVKCGSDDSSTIHALDVFECETSARLFRRDPTGKTALVNLESEDRIFAIAEDLRSAVSKDGSFLIWQKTDAATVPPRSARPESTPRDWSEVFARACEALAFKPEAFRLSDQLRSRCAQAVRTGGFASQDFVALRSPIELGAYHAQYSRRPSAVQ